MGVLVVTCIIVHLCWPVHACPTAAGERLVEATAWPGGTHTDCCLFRSEQGARSDLAVW
jgi:hypothetical protein